MTRGKILKFAKYFLFILNLLIFLFGSILVGLGIYLQITWTSTFSFFGVGVVTIPVSLILLGLILVLLGGLSCCGAVTENRYLLTTYILLVVVMMIGETSMFTCFDKVLIKFEAKALRNMLFLMQNVEKDVAANQTWRYVHKRFQCCGTRGPEDWVFVKNVDLRHLPEEFVMNWVNGDWNNQDMLGKMTENQTGMIKAAEMLTKDLLGSHVLPATCCLPNTTGDCHRKNASPGCWLKLEEYFESKSQTLMASLFAGVSIEVLMFLCALILAVFAERESSKEQF